MMGEGYKTRARVVKERTKAPEKIRKTNVNNLKKAWASRKRFPIVVTDADRRAVGEIP